MSEEGNKATVVLLEDPSPDEGEFIVRCPKCGYNEVQCDHRDGVLTCRTCKFSSNSMRLHDKLRGAVIPAPVVREVYDGRINFIDSHLVLSTQKGEHLWAGALVPAHWVGRTVEVTARSWNAERQQEQPTEPRSGQRLRLVQG